MVGIVLILVAVFYAFNTFIYNEKQADTALPSMKTGPVTVFPIEHATMVLSWDDAAFYTDPVGGSAAFDGRPLPTIILLTDIHGDHLDADTLRAIQGEATLIAPQEVKDKLPEDLATQVRVLGNGETMEEQGFTIEAVPMYNLPDAANATFHTKGRGNGYIVSKDGFRVYIAGDTAGTPEMRALTAIDIAFVPMNLPYTMDEAEASDAVLAFKPKQVYPYHYRGPNGLSDVEKFKSLVMAGNPAIDVVLLNWYPNP